MVQGTPPVLHLSCSRELRVRADEASSGEVVLIAVKSVLIMLKMMAMVVMIQRLSIRREGNLFIV